MTDLTEYLAAIAPHLWEGRGSVCRVHDWFSEIRHPEFPLVLNFHPKTEAGKHKVSVSASLPRGVGGSHVNRSLGRHTDTGREAPYQAVDPRRTFSANRFLETPGKVAQEIEHHVSGPAIPLSLLALKAVADRHALEHRFESLARDLADRHGLQFSTWGDSMHLHDPVKRFDPQGWGTVRIDKGGYCQIEIRHLGEAKLVELIDWFCAGGRSDQSTENQGAYPCKVTKGKA